MPSRRLSKGGGTVTLTGDALITDVLDGKTFYNDDAQTKLEGTLVPLDTSDATASAAEILAGETAYVNGEKITGTYNPEKTITPTTLTIPLVITNSVTTSVAAI